MSGREDRIREFCEAMALNAKLGMERAEAELAGSDPGERDSAYNVAHCHGELEAATTILGFVEADDDTQAQLIAAKR